MLAEHLHAFIFAGDLMAAKNNYVKAAEKYRKALTVNPDSQPALARLAICLLGQ